jgi:hypothetical protein
VQDPAGEQVVADGAPAEAGVRRDRAGELGREGEDNQRRDPATGPPDRDSLDRFGLSGRRQGLARVGAGNGAAE